MSNLTDRVSFLKGLCEGMKLDTETNEGKLLVKIIDVLGEMAEEVTTLRDSHDELEEYVESIDDDLSMLEENIMDEDDGEGCSCCHAHDDDDDDDDENGDDEDDEGGELIQYSCPSCGHPIELRAAELDFDEDYICPECGKPIFPENEEEASTEEDGDDE